MRFLAVIEEAPVMERILRHICVDCLRGQELSLRKCLLSVGSSQMLMIRKGCLLATTQFGSDVPTPDI